MQNRTFYGKYRGVVTDINDPLKMGRIQARVPDVLGTDVSSWALPSVPFAGDGMGFYGLPKVGAGVWIEFEQGDPDYPIWSGCWWGDASQLPDDVKSEPYKRVAIVTSNGQKIILDDSQTGEITIQTQGGQKMVMNSTSIKIDFGSGVTLEMSTASIKMNDGAAATVELSGPKVSVNNGALEVL
jgi:uncharacterized protein involved in type VI secretion and phage assembly